MSDGFGSSLRAKIAAGLATTLLVLVVGGASYYAVRRSTRAAELVSHTDSVLIEREKVLSALKDAETGARGYVLTGQAEFLEPFNGATNPANAADGTIRKLFARSIEANSVHGSDSAENARAEIAYFFAQTELVKYDWKR